MSQFSFQLFTHTGRILFAPFLCKSGKIAFSFLEGHCCIDFLKISNNLLDVLVADVLGGAANLMHNAALQPALREHRFNGLEHPAETIGVKQINILYAPAFEVIQHIQPEYAALMLPDPDIKNVFSTVHCNTENDVSRLRNIPMILFHLVVNGIHKHKGIHALQRTVLPGGDFRHNFLTDLCHQLRGDFDIVESLDLLSDVPLAHPAGIQCQNLLFHAVSVAVILADDLRLIGAIAITGYLDVYFTELRLDGLLGITVAIIARRTLCGI